MTQQKIIKQLRKKFSEDPSRRIDRVENMTPKILQLWIDLYKTGGDYSIIKNKELLRFRTDKDNRVRENPTYVVMDMESNPRLYRLFEIIPTCVYPHNYILTLKRVTITDSGVIKEEQPEIRIAPFNEIIPYFLFN